MFFIYTGLEAAAGVWPYSLVTEARAIPISTAGMWVSVYWGGLTAGRLLSGIVAGFVPVRLLLRLCIVGIALGATLVWLQLADLFSFLGLALMGLSSAQVFPMLIATTPARLGDAHTANGVGFQIAAAVLARIAAGHTRGAGAQPGPGDRRSQSADRGDPAAGAV